nr:hypothetical protein [uncultured Acidovorax sp.]
MPIYESSPEFDVVRARFEEAALLEAEAAAALSTAGLNGERDNEVLLKLTKRLEDLTTQKMNIYEEMQQFVLKS